MRRQIEEFSTDQDNLQEGKRNMSDKDQMIRKNMLDRYLCPIDNNIMKSPVLASDGHYYQQTNIRRFMSNHKNSPMTGLPFPSKQLIPNFQIKCQIEKYLAACSQHKQKSLKIDQFFIRRNNYQEKQVFMYQSSNTLKHFQKEVHTTLGIYLGSWKNGHMHGKGKLQMKNGGFYEGQFIEGKFHGNGKITGQQNQSYEGEFKRGKRSGMGKQIYKNGQSYEGAWLNDERFGNGVLKTKQGDIIYEGNWKNGKRCGLGTNFSIQGIYEGDWLNGMRTGYGCMTYANGTMYKGEWKQNTWNGKGECVRGILTQKGTWIKNQKNGNFRLEYEDGSLEYVTFQNNWKVGQGYHQLNNGDYYVGQYKIVKEGIGKEKQGDEYYEGEFEGELRNGFGKLYVEKQQKKKRKNVLIEQPYFLVYEGQFSYGLRYGYGTGYSKNGDTYTGYWRGEAKHGLGTLTLRNGTIFQGQFFRNSIRGKARIKYTNGDEYYGQVRSYKRHGFGRLQTTLGVHQGLWERDIFRNAVSNEKKTQNLIIQSKQLLQVN